MLKNSSIKCSHCGSTNTEIRDTPPRGGLLNELKERTFSLAPSHGQRFMCGQKFIFCKDCGTISCINIL